MNSRSFAGAVTALAVVVLLAAAGSATATVTVTYNQGTTTLTGDAGHDDVVAGFLSGGDCPVAACDDFAAAVGASGYTDIAAGAGCWPRTGGGALCPDAASFAGDLGAGNDSLTFDPSLSYASAVIHGGDGDDQLTGTSATGYPEADVFYGDAGSDTLKGLSGQDELHGGPGADYLYGGDGRDMLYGDADGDWMNGGPGDDSLDGGEGDDQLAWVEPSTTSSGGSDPGSDTLIGGSGTDTVNYGEYDVAGPVTVRLDNQANDGAAGENDNVAGDVEIVQGTNGNDTLIGNAGANTFFGAAGNDRIEGGDGPDVIEGGGGDDSIDAGGGADVVHGDFTACSFSWWGDCPTGVDTIEARDGVRDDIECGPLTDSANVDAVDTVMTDGVMACENVVRQGGSIDPNNPTNNTGQVSPPLDLIPPRIGLGDAALTLVAGVVAVHVSCPGEAGICTGTVTLATAGKVRVAARRAVVQLGSSAFVAQPGTRASVRIRLRARARRIVQRARRLRVQLTTKASDVAGNTAVATKRLVLSAKRAR